MTAARERLHEAVEAVVAELRDGDAGVVVDWICVVQTTSWEGDHQYSGYYNLFSGGQMPEHRAVGLLDYGAHLIKFGTNTDEGD